MGLTVGRVTFEGGLNITDVRPASRSRGVIGVSNLLRTLGIVRGPLHWPLPCLDLDDLHQRNAERVKARTKRKKGL